MDENLLTNDDIIESGNDYTDDDNISTDDDLLIDSEEASAIAEASESIISVDFDYSYIMQTNEYLSVIIILLVTFICIFIFNQLRYFFQRLGG